MKLEKIVWSVPENTEWLAHYGDYTVYLHFEGGQQVTATLFGLYFNHHSEKFPGVIREIKKEEK